MISCRRHTLCTEHAVDIAVVNGDAHVVLGGLAPSPDIGQRVVAESIGARTTRLRVSVPSHTHWLSSAADEFTRQLACTEMRAPRVPVLAGITGRPVRDVTQAVESLGKQIESTVQWHQCVLQAIERGAAVFFELGPGTALARMVSEIQPNRHVRSLDEFRSILGAVSWIQGMLND